MAAPKVDVVIKNACGSVGEGPHWDDASQKLYYVDIQRMDVHRYDPATGKDEAKHFKDTVSFVVPRRAGGYMVGLGRRLALFEWDTGMVSTVQEVERDEGNRFNDGKCDPKGRLWAGTMGPQVGNLKFEQEAGSLYCLDVDRSIEKKEKKVTISNGLAWTDDNRTMFYIDTIPQKVYAYDYNVENGDISNRRTVVDYKEYGLPDGMTIDTDGKIWVATYNAGAIFKFDPETGKMLQKISIPARETTSVAWGGKHLDELYVTTGHVALAPDEFATKDPLAGSLFKVTGTGSKGRPAYMYEG